MDEDPRIPESYFGLVVSINSLGWTPDLPGSRSFIYSDLKPGGKFIFSCEHAIYQCLGLDANSKKYFFRRSYLDENPQIDPSWKGLEIVLRPRKLSTSINAMTDAGLMVERLIESEVKTSLASTKDYSPEKC